MLTLQNVLGVLLLVFLYGLASVLTKKYFESKGTPLEDGKEKWWFILVFFLLLNFIYTLPENIINYITSKYNTYKSKKQVEKALKIVEERKLEKK